MDTAWTGPRRAKVKNMSFPKISNQFYVVLFYPISADDDKNV